MAIKNLVIWQLFFRFLTWCKAVSPSILAVSMSAPRFWSLSTSSLSDAAQAAKKTQPSVNWILCDFRLGSESWELVSLSDHLFNCSALLKRAEEFRFSNEVIIVESLETFRSQQFDEIYLKSFYLVKDWLQESLQKMFLFLAQSKREGRKWSACVYCCTHASS